MCIATAKFVGQPTVNPLNELAFLRGQRGRAWPVPQRERLLLECVEFLRSQLLDRFQQVRAANSGGCHGNAFGAKRHYHRATAVLALSTANAIVLPPGNGP